MSLDELISVAAAFKFGYVCGTEGVEVKDGYHCGVGGNYTVYTQDMHRFFIKVPTHRNSNDYDLYRLMKDGKDFIPPLEDLSLEDTPKISKELQKILQVISDKLADLED